MVTGDMRQAVRGQTAFSAPQTLHSPLLPSRCQHKRPRMTQAVAIPEIASIASTVQTFVDTIASAAPEPLQPAVQVIGGDIASVAALQPTIAGLARLTVSSDSSAPCPPHWSCPIHHQIQLAVLFCGPISRMQQCLNRLLGAVGWFVCAQGLYYLLGTTPNPVLGALDFYVAQPLSNIFKKNYDAPDFALREK